MCPVYTQRGDPMYTTGMGREPFLDLLPDDSEPPPEPSFPVTVPAWFLQMCIKTTEELRMSNIPLVVLDVPDHKSVDITSQPAFFSEQYAMDSAMYESLLDVFIPHAGSKAAAAETTAPSGGTIQSRSRAAMSEAKAKIQEHVQGIGPKPKPKPGTKAAEACGLFDELPYRDLGAGAQDQVAKKDSQFWNDAVWISFPDNHSAQGTSHFFTTVVQSLARDIEADLMQLDGDDLDDIEDLLPDAESYQKPAYWTRLFDTLFTSPAAKRKGTTTSEASQRPLIVHVHITPPSGRREVCLEGLCKAVLKSLVDVLVLCTMTDPSRAQSTKDDGTHVEDDDGYSEFDDRAYRPYERFPHSYSPFPAPTKEVSMERLCLGMLDKFPKFGINPRSDLLSLVPILNETQSALLANHRAFEGLYERCNVRLIKRRLRSISDNHQKLAVLQPNVHWRFLEGTPTQDMLLKTNITSDDLDSLEHSLSFSLSEEDITAAVLRMGSRIRSIDEWQNSRQASRWSGFPDNIQTVIQRIENGGRQYKWEKQFLPQLIKPEDVEEGWDDIAVDPDVRQNIIQLLSQRCKPDKPLYGILKRAYVGGALLYGPPGTGKTHLARVLAKEFAGTLTMISVSPADIEHEYVGEIEKAIKALFNLARLLFPSVIFIDEADAVFRSRTSRDRSWERNKTNQFLMEMDGIKRTQKPPFVILATNYPRQLDHGVLRRVPGRIHLGLPTLEERRRIFEIYLRDEVVHPDLDVARLAELTTGYSGSDIQTVAVQAALSCDTVVSETDNRRLLCHAHFEKALQRNGATTSKSALAEITAFAREYDSSALEKMRTRDQTKVNDKPLAPPSPWPDVKKKAPTMNGHKTTMDGIRPQVSTIVKTRVPSSAWNKFPTDLPKVRIEELNDKDEDTKLPYRYSPLKSDKNEIRVLAFQPSQSSCNGVGDTQELLRCSLKTVSLTDFIPLYGQIKSLLDAGNEPTAPNYRLNCWQSLSAILRKDGSGRLPDAQETLDKYWKILMEHNNDVPFDGVENMIPRFNWGDYIALSYVWGDQNDCKDILLDGCRFSVTSNLHDVLLSLQHSFQEHTAVFFWVDAICINQNDLSERESEVKKMHMIYSHCLLMEAWLGPSTLEVDAKFPAILDLLETCDGLIHAWQASACWDAVETLDAVNELWTIGTSLHATKYWERLWILQEIALAPSLLFRYGPHTLDRAQLQCICMLFSIGISTQKFQSVDPGYAEQLMTTLLLALQRLGRLRMPMDPTFGGLINTHRNHTDHVSCTCYRSLPLDLNDLIRLAQESKATDPRDKVYGILALYPEAIAERIQVTYSPAISFQDVCTAFSKTCFDVEGNLNLLGNTQKRPSLLRNTGTMPPSWILDLEAGRAAGAPVLATRRKYAANKGLGPSRIEYSPDGAIMLCEGFIVDGFHALAGTQMWHEDLDAMVKLPPAARDATSGMATKHDWSRSLARVLLQNSSLEIDHADGSPSILDIPWMDPAEITDSTKPSVDYRYYGVGAGGEASLPPEDVPWSDFIHASPLQQTFLASLWDNESYPIGADTLRSYFPSLEEFCPDAKAFMAIAQEMRMHLAGQRLCTTAAGLSGTAPDFATLGDVIAVLALCDTPVVLRKVTRGPNNGCYRVVGRCFVDGIMEGEVAARLEGGELEVTRIRLC